MASDQERGARPRLVQGEAYRVPRLGSQAQELAVRDQGSAEGVRPDRRKHQGVTERGSDYRRGAEAAGR